MSIPHKQLGQIARKVYDADPPPPRTLHGMLRDDYAIGVKGDIVEIDVSTLAIRTYHAEDLSREHREMCDGMVEVAKALISGCNRKEALTLLWDAMPLEARRKAEGKGVAL